MQAFHLLLILLQCAVMYHTNHFQLYALQHLAKGLKEGGMLAFETRNPKAKAWKEWHQENEIRDTPAGKLCETTIIEPPDENGVVTMHIHNEFLNHN